MGNNSGRYPLWELLERPSTFGRREHSAVRAEGTRVLFADGRWRQCATSGLWNVNLGYGNRAVAGAVHTALLETSYFSLFRSGHEPAVAASRALLDVCGPEHFGRVVHSTSGSAANDLTMKLARQYWALHRQFRRRVIVGLKGSYHGLTYGSHGLTGMSLGQSYYGVDQRLIRHVSHEDPTELEELLRAEGEQIAAVVVEPVLGTGALPLPEPMLAALARLRAEYGFLLVADEVATGFGRTGSYFASQNWPEPPDIMLASKGMTNGTCAAAAVVVSHAVCDVFDRHDAALTHAETQAGAPPTCAAILATIEEMERLQALEQAAAVTAALDGLLAELAAHPLVAGDNGLGCFRALRLGVNGDDLPEQAVRQVVEEVREAGALVSAGPSRLQLAPALVYQAADVELLAAALRSGLDRAAEWLLAGEATGA
ncbi:daptide-type RiPP biosynthesis aminotransferase [Kitasatospora sp. A2-31]|uniref:daptide-type RiPP biosynthesis aminotransferase n=1 Tax=Kitasatospora sp. A2-31 TaxID=2916414 RepID=UPI001EEC9D26|nr:daptide-type RiPP biosynthesis aminotransferase [Kitasatospora sp. A2-31]MCG6495367.1 aminotransferase class III-fold pyridoxal phosphate-dependent enzyme [Kitasatospora sp. A2-31]